MRKAISYIFGTITFFILLALPAGINWLFGKKIIYPIVSEGSDYFAYIGAVGTLVMAVLAWWTIRGSRKQLRYQTESTMHAKLSDAVATLESSLFPEQAQLAYDSVINKEFRDAKRYLTLASTNLENANRNIKLLFTDSKLLTKYEQECEPYVNSIIAEMRAVMKLAELICTIDRNKGIETWDVIFERFIERSYSHQETKVLNAAKDYLETDIEFLKEQAGRILFMTTQGSVPAMSLEEGLRNLLDANYNRVKAILN